MTLIPLTSVQKKDSPEQHHFQAPKQVLESER